MSWTIEDSTKVPITLDWSFLFDIYLSSRAIGCQWIFVCVFVCLPVNSSETTYPNEMISLRVQMVLG